MLRDECTVCLDGGNRGSSECISKMKRGDGGGSDQPGGRPPGGWKNKTKTGQIKNVLLLVTTLPLPLLDKTVQKELLLICRGRRSTIFCLWSFASSDSSASFTSVIHKEISDTRSCDVLFCRGKLYLPCAASGRHYFFSFIIIIIREIRFFHLFFFFNFN